MRIILYQTSEGEERRGEGRRGDEEEKMKKSNMRYKERKDSTR